MAEATRREALEKAWSEAEKESEEKEEKVEAEKPELENSESKEPEGEAPEGEQPEGEKPDPYQQEQKVAAEREQPDRTTPDPTDRPPAGWKPAAKEQWAKLPAEIRAEVSRRELQIQQTLSQTDNVRKFANEFAQVIQPYSHLIRQQNSTPLQAVDNLMQTAARLMTGSQEQKAQVVAEIIGNYGIDIQTLDNVLSKVVKDGRVPSNQPEQPPAWARPMFEFMSTVQQRQQQALERARMEAEQEIQKFSDKPFFEDLREDIADIMEIAANRGRTLTLEQAYERALAANPELSRIIEQRKKASNPVSEAAATLARARKAASTVSGAPQTGKLTGKEAPKSRREIIAAAFDSQDD